MKYIAYYRVSLGKQNEVALRLENQRGRIQNALALMGGGEIISEHVDEESSDKSNKRSNLKKALVQARKSGAVIIVASLDRISQNVNYIISLMATDVTFVAAEQLENKTVLHVMASFSHTEGGALDADYDSQSKVPQRTRYALKMLRASALKVGTSYNLTAAAQQKGAEAVKQKAIENVANRRATAVALSLKRQGKNLTEIAFELNTGGFTTATGKQFQPVQVLRLLQRAEQRAEKINRLDFIQPDLFGESTR